MADDSSSLTGLTSVNSPKPKPSRTNSNTAAPRSRPRSPASGDSEARPQKRARKAINCEPCRNSKLKCDRNRPCSSCVLRGTTASCYKDGGGTEPAAEWRPPASTRGSNTNGNSDAAQEFARIRQSLAVLESQLFPNGVRPSLPTPSQPQPSPPAKIEGELYTAPGMLASDDQGGLYTGATSAATHLMLGEARATEEGAENADNGPNTPLSLSPQDTELLSKLPSTETINEFVTEYFSYCNWIYRHINEKAFMKKWKLFKTGVSYDRITLATVCLMMAVALHYLPSGHNLLQQTGMSFEELSSEYATIAKTALRYHQAETRNYSVGLIEALLLKTHYYYLIKTEGEDLWHSTGELVIFATAMGLHRDPGQWKMSREVAERRRWAWWHIVLLERWQCFMFGRPLIIASHHFDTELPQLCDPSIDPTGRIFLPNLALFKLAYLLGDVVDHALSVRAVPYAKIKASDLALQEWLDTLPSEIVLDEYGVARNLASTDAGIRRFGVQSVIIRTAFYHIRFTLHRPYATAANARSMVRTKRHMVDPVNCAQSLEIAVGAADKLITIVSQSRPDFLANTCLAVPGHLGWAPLHAFSASLFFVFQLIANPDQPGAGMFRSSIDKALMTLNECRGRGVSIAEKACEILHSLGPLYSGNFQRETPDIREATKSQVLRTVRKLNLPYYDSHAHRRASESPATRLESIPAIPSPVTSTSMSPASGPSGTNGTYESFPGHHLLSTVRGMDTANTSLSPMFSNSPGQPSVNMNGAYSQSTTPNGSYDSPSNYQPFNENFRFANFIEDNTVWGASTGFGQGEWSQLLSVLQPHGQMSMASPSMGR